MATAEQSPPIPPAAPEVDVATATEPPAPIAPAPAQFADPPPPPRSRNSIIISTSGEGSERYEVRAGSLRPRSLASRTSSSRTYSSASSESSGWDKIEVPYDDIVPSDSASRSRQPSRRPIAEERPAPSRQHSSRRATVDRDEVPRRHPSSRRRHHSRRHRSESRRTPSDDSEVASYDDYPYSHHGAPVAPQPPRGAYPPSGYRHVAAPPPSHGGYPHSIDPYAAQALVHMPHDPYMPPPQHNPFHPPPSNPFSPVGNAAGSSYFTADPHAPSHHSYRPPAPPRPQSYAAPSHYGSEMMHYSGMSPVGYPPYAMPGYPPWAYSIPPSTTTGSSQKDDKDKEARASELESLKALIQKHEEARLEAEKARLEKEKKEAAAAALKIAEEEAEKRRKADIDAASKSAKEAAEKKAADEAKKAKDEHETKMAEAKKAQEELEKKTKSLEEEAAKNKPAPDTLKAPIRFKDAVGRKFSFPFHLCKTWKGMEGLIRQAFLHVDGLGDHVAHGHYDLTGPDGEIILPQVWDTMIQPDWEIVMHMWPLPEPPKEDKLAADANLISDPFAGLNLGDLMEPGKRGKKKDGKKSKKAGSPDHIIEVGPSGPIPPPPGLPPGFTMDDMMVGASKPRKRAKSKEVSGLTAWMIGGRVPSKKR